MIRRVRLPRAAMAALLLVGTCTGGCRRPPPPEAHEAPEDMAVPVAATLAVVGSVRASVHATGVVRPSEGAEFLAGAPETARVLDVPKAEGDPVTSGEVLARFDLPVANQEMARYRADMAQAQANVERARQAQIRTDDLVDRGLIPRRDRDDARRQVSEAQATLDRVTAALASSQAAVARSVVRAPFSGVIAARLHEPGDLVQGTSTDPVVRLVDPTRLEIVASIDDADAARVVPGASARTTNPTDGQPVPLTVAGAPQHAAAPGSTTTVRLAFRDTTPIEVDATVDVQIDAEERRDLVFIPQEAVLRVNGDTVVMVAVGDRAEQRRVVTGTSSQGRIAIAAGVGVGELVIMRGHVGLSDGALVSVAVEQR